MIPLKKWLSISHAVNPGDFVLISEDKVARGLWQRARVESTHLGRDGLVRSVTLRLPSGRQTRRPVQRLHLIETVDADVVELP